MNTLKDFMNNNKKYVYLMISILIIVVVIIVAVLVNITNKGSRDASDTAVATIESRADSQVLTESTIDKNEDNDKAVSTDNESAENSDNDIAQKDDTEASKETSESDEQSQLAGNDNDVSNDNSQEQYISSDNSGSDDEDGAAADDNNVNQDVSSDHIVYNADGSLNLQESYWESYKGWKASGKITAKTQQWIVVYPDGSEYHFLFDGYNYRKMPLWNE